MWPNVGINVAQKNSSRCPKVFVKKECSIKYTQRLPNFWATFAQKFVDKNFYKSSLITYLQLFKVLVTFKSTFSFICVVYPRRKCVSIAQSNH